MLDWRGELFVIVVSVAVARTNRIIMIRIITSSGSADIWDRIR